MGTKTMFRITYLNRLTGDRERYMNNTAWDTREDAEYEIDRLKKMSEDWLKKSVEELRSMANSGTILRSWSIGKDWKTQPVKLRSL